MNFFKNMTIFGIQEWPPMPSAKLEALLGNVRFSPCGPMDIQSRGWVPPTGDQLAYHHGGVILLSLMVEQKMLPAAVVNRVAGERAAKLAEQQGYPAGRKQIKELRELVRDELLPRAFTKCSATGIWINPSAGLLVLDTASPGKVDDSMELLGKTLGGEGVKFFRLNTATSPSAAMTDWLAGGDAPAGFSIGRECELKSPVEEKSAVRYLRHTLEGDDVRQHIAAGKLPTRLDMCWDDRASFVLTETMQLKKLRFLDVALEEAPQDAENAAEQFEADLALMSGEFNRLIPAVLDALGGEVQQ